MRVIRTKKKETAASMVKVDDHLNEENEETETGQSDEELSVENEDGRSIESPADTTALTETSPSGTSRHEQQESLPVATSSCSSSSNAPTKTTSASLTKAVQAIKSRIERENRKIQIEVHPSPSANAESSCTKQAIQQTGPSQLERMQDKIMQCRLNQQQLQEQADSKTGDPTDNIRGVEMSREDQSFTQPGDEMAITSNDRSHTDAVLHYSAERQDFSSEDTFSEDNLLSSFPSAAAGDMSAPTRRSRRTALFSSVSTTQTSTEDPQHISHAFDDDGDAVPGAFFAPGRAFGAIPHRIGQTISNRFGGDNNSSNNNNNNFEASNDPGTPELTAVLVEDPELAEATLFKNSWYDHKPRILAAIAFVAACIVAIVVVSVVLTRDDSPSPAIAIAAPPTTSPAPSFAPSMRIDSNVTFALTLDG